MDNIKEGYRIECGVSCTTVNPFLRLNCTETHLNVLHKHPVHKRFSYTRYVFNRFYLFRKFLFLEFFFWGYTSPFLLYYFSPLSYTLH